MIDILTRSSFTDIIIVDKDLQGFKVGLNKIIVINFDIQQLAYVLG